MSADSTAAPISRTSPRVALAGHEIRRYARHPLFLVGALLTVAFMVVIGPDRSTSSLFDVIVPATTLGLFGLLVMVSLTRSSERAAAASGAATPERDRSLALAAATVVPLVVAVVFFVWSVWAYHAHPPVAGAIPFGGVGDGWVHAILFDLVVVSAVGGPLLGLVIARWADFRGAGIVTVVALVLVTIAFQGIVAPLRYVRVFVPWTYFGGPIGIKGDSSRALILTGSPQWYGAYLIALCAIGVVVAMLHDREQDRRPLVRVLAGLLFAALVLGVLAMTLGVQHVMVDPHHGV